MLRRGVFNAAGPVAGGERHLFLIVLAVLAFVVAPVLLLTPLFAWHYRLSNSKNAYRPNWGFSWPLEGLIWIPPTLIVAGLGWFLWRDTHRFDPYAPVAGAAGPPLRVEAVALDWKWLFVYPDLGLATVNELDVPAGRAVRLELTSGTVMQSLLMPQLAGQIYAMAGMSTKLNFAAARPGVFLGENTLYNGFHFQDQKFHVVARTPEAFAGWANHARSTAPPLTEAALATVLDRSTLPPLTYSSPPPNLYARILADSREPAPPPKARKTS